MSIEITRNQPFDTDLHVEDPTVLALRQMTYEGQPTFLPGIHYQYCEDQKYATINISSVQPESEEGEIGLTLWMTWYKSRRATDAIYVLTNGAPPRVPTLGELDLIVAHYKAIEKQ